MSRHHFLCHYFGLAVLLVASVGCRPSPEGAGESLIVDQTTDETNRSLPPIPDESSATPIAAPINGGPSSDQGGRRPDAADRLEENMPGDASSTAGNGSETSDYRFPLATTDPVGQKPDVGLKPDLTPDELMKFLMQADQDMHTISSGASGIRDPQKARQTLFQIIRLKQEAARRLAENESIDPKLRTEGRRGQLQALSHLASLGQLEAAKELRELATANLQSNDPKLVSDSRLVLLGFRLEELQNGIEGSKTTILELIADLAQNVSDQDVPAMMVMGRARDMLNRYGHLEESRQVREFILSRFAGSPDPQIAKLAAQVSGNVVFDGVDEMLDQIIKGGEVTDAAWSEAIGKLIDEAPDLQTVQYLAGAALDLESRDLNASANVIYEVLQQRFEDPDAATSREVTAATQARDRRREAIGKAFSLDLPSLNQSDLSIKDYQGKIVLMPFWAASFPQSLQVVPALQDIVKRHPQDVALVGMNLDLTATEAAVYAKTTDLGFPSFRAHSMGDPTQGNPVAIQFGMVSMPFVIMIDGQGNVAEIDFSGQKIQPTVDRLLSTKAPN